MGSSRIMARNPNIPCFPRKSLSCRHTPTLRGKGTHTQVQVSLGPEGPWLHLSKHSFQKSPLPFPPITQTHTGFQFHDPREFHKNLRLGAKEVEAYTCCWASKPTPWARKGASQVAPSIINYTPPRRYYTSNSKNRGGCGKISS